MAKKLPSKEQVANNLREALMPYINTADLLHYAASGQDLKGALIDPRNTPAEALALLDVLATVLAPQQLPQIRSPQDCAALCMVDMSRLQQEELRICLLDTKNQVRGWETLYRGTLNSATIRIAEVFKAAIINSCAAIIVVHNHPSGEPRPSPEDVLITRQIVAAGKLLEIDVLDHLVIGQGKWASIRELNSDVFK